MHTSVLTPREPALDAISLLFTIYVANESTYSSTMLYYSCEIEFMSSVRVRYEARSILVSPRSERQSVWWFWPKLRVPESFLTPGEEDELLRYIDTSPQTTSTTQVHSSSTPQHTGTRSHNNTMFAARQATQSVLGAVQRRAFSVTAANVSTPGSSL